MPRAPRVNSEDPPHPSSPGRALELASRVGPRHTLGVYNTRQEPFNLALDEPAEEPRWCDHPGCQEEGVYPAPRSRKKLTNYYWFCLGHVRAYNAAWNYYTGMSETEIEAHIRADTVWRRPTWPIGGRVLHGWRAAYGRPDDVFGLFASAGNGRGPEGASERRPWRPQTPEEEALAILNLDSSVTRGRIKARYKELAKRHHPDANGGDKTGEDRLKRINQAYTTLKNAFLC